MDVLEPPAPAAGAADLTGSAGLRPIGLGDYLSADNVWTLRLLGVEPFHRRRDRDQVEREYNRDLYGSLLHSFQADPDLPRRWVLEPSDEEVVFSLRDEIFVAPLSAFLAIKRQQIVATLDRYVRTSAVCELGAGYGQNFLWLAPALGADLYGGEFAANAVALGRQLGFDIRSFDFHDPESYGLIRPATTVFTCHAIEQVPDARIVIDALRRRKDRIDAVVHFEPLHREDRRNLIGLLRNRYADINDYNHNLLDCVRSDREIEVLQLEPDVFGRSPLNPTSILVWKFR